MTDPQGIPSDAHVSRHELLLCDRCECEAVVPVTPVALTVPDVLSTLNELSVPLVVDETSAVLAALVVPVPVP